MHIPSIHSLTVRLVVLSALLGAGADTFSRGAELPRYLQANLHTEPKTENRKMVAMRNGANLSLQEGIILYDEGDYSGAIAKFLESEMESTSSSIRVEALKYAAFSYCVTGRMDQCRRAFERALKIDARFSLNKGEAGHPVWGPVFQHTRIARPSRVPARVPKTPSTTAMREVAPVADLPVREKEAIVRIPYLEEKIFTNTQALEKQQRDRWRHADVWRSH